VGLGIEFAWAQWKGEEIQEGFLVSGILIPLIIPVNCPLWILAVAVAFAVIIGKEIFGGTGMNIFNPALLCRAFLFFAYPTKMSGDQVWVANDSIFGLGNTLPDGFTMATPLGEIGQGATVSASLNDMILGFIPGSIGETSVIAIALTNEAIQCLLRCIFGYGRITDTAFCASICVMLTLIVARLIVEIISYPIFIKEIIS
jgi:Na+-transporting NADH:ubiquinone oxidoreductase subunit B